MPQSGFTPIKLYLSTTAAAVPLAANLDPGELALNNNDGKLYYEDSSGVVQVIATKAGSSGDVVGPASSTANAVPTFSGTTGKLIQNNTGVTIASNVLTATGFAGALNGTVGATTASTGAFTTVSVTGAITSTLVTGTAPLVVASTTNVANLNASSLNGATFAAPGAIGSGTASTGAFTTLSSVGTTSATAFKVANITETANIVGSAPSATTNFYVNAGAVQFYTTSAANNWTLNIAFSSGTSLNTAMAIGDSISVTMLSTQGATAYYNSAVTIDGASVTPKWQGGTAPTTGNASGIDIYTYAIIKTASATYTVLASQTKFA